MRRKPPARHNIGIDLNARVLAKFQCDYPVELIRGCAHQLLRQYDHQGRGEADLGLGDLRAIAERFTELLLQGSNVSRA